MKEIFKIEAIKNKTIYINFLLLLSSVSVSLLIDKYISLSNKGESFYLIYFKIFGFITSVIIPLIMTAVFFREERNNTFKNMMVVSKSFHQIINNQITYYIVYYILFMILSLVISILMTDSTINFYQIIIIELLQILLLPVQFIIAEIFLIKYGIGGGMCDAILGLFISLLSITPLLDYFWVLLPWSWPIRLIIFGIPYIIKQNIFYWVFCLMMCLLIYVVLYKIYSYFIQYKFN